MCDPLDGCNRLPAIKASQPSDTRIGLVIKYQAIEKEFLFDK